MAKESEVKGNIMYLVCYLFTWLTGLIFYFTQAKDNPEMKFHSVQAILLGIGMFIPLVNILVWLYSIYVGYQVYSTGERIHVPVIGEYAEKFSAGK